MKKYDIQDDYGAGTIEPENALSASNPTLNEGRAPADCTTPSTRESLIPERTQRRKPSTLWKILWEKRPRWNRISSKTREQGRLPSVVTTPEILRYTTERSALVKRRNENTSLRRKFVWQERDKENLQDAIQNLRRGNNNLESVLALRDPRDIAPLFAVSEDVQPGWPSAEGVDRALASLHDGLAAINVSNEHEPYTFSVQLKENHEESRQDLGQPQFGVTLTPASLVFNVMGDTGQQTSTKATNEMFVVESVPASSQPPGDTKQQVLTSLDRPRSLGPVAATSAVERWGYIGHESVSRFRHIIYRSVDAPNTWRDRSTLSAILESPEYREHMRPGQVMKLARLLLLTHLHFTSVRRKCGEPRVEHFQCYRAADESSNWDDDDPIVLRLWLSIGFGSQPRPRALGRRSGIAKLADFAILELGLLLYQIGSAANIDYGSELDGVMKAREDVLSRLDVLDGRVGSSYVEVVQSLLNFKFQYSLVSSQNRGNEEASHVKMLFQKLLESEGYLQGSITIPSLRAPFEAITDQRQLNMGSPRDSFTSTLASSSHTNGSENHPKRPAQEAEPAIALRTLRGNSANVPRARSTTGVGKTTLSTVDGLHRSVVTQDA